MKKIVPLFLLCFVAFSCKKDEAASCSWQTSTLSGKNYKITKVVIAGFDVTSLTLSGDPCYKNTFLYKSDSTYTETLSSGCSSPWGGSGKWKVITASSKNYIIVGGDTTQVKSFDCNSFTTLESFSNTEITFTKQ